LGVTATSSETPDSIELFKVVTHHVDAEHSRQKQEQHQQHQQYQPPAQDQHAQSGSNWMIPDALASKFKDQQSQFEDVHGRVQAIAHQVDTVIQEIHRTSANLQGRVEELHHDLAKQYNMEKLESRIANLENRIEALKREQKDWTGHFNDIHASLKARHDTLLSALPESVGSGKNLYRGPSYV
jgi:DNA repair exonuclease SbcCD ATPase subunit